MKRIKYINILIVFIIINSIIGYGQGKIVTLSGSLTGTQDKVARDAVILEEGFNYAASGSYTFTARTDETLICNTEYLTGTSIPDPTDRDLNTSYEVGSTPGFFNVTSGGSASYSVPIFVSPGTAGMQPSLSVNYNSNSGYGLVGKGWNLSGISVIYRVPSDFYHDGEVDPIDYDSNDAFVLDGMRLIKDGTIYRPELEDYSTITPTYSGSAITKFTVRTKNGKTIEYGGTTASKQSNVDGTRYFAWYITKVQDAFGNYMLYTYENDEDNGLRLTKIDYTGNSSANLDPYNTIYFLYEEREDARTSYVYGKPVKHNLILRKIRCEAEETTSHSYEFNYISDSDVSLLAEIIEFGSDNSRFNSTVFNYHDYQEGSWIESTGLFDNFSKKLYGDINGDGRTDLILKSGNYIRSYIINNDGSLTEGGYINAGTSNFEVGDFNGDEKTDIIVYTTTSIQYYRSNGHGFVYISSSDIDNLQNIENIFGFDVNGDNIEDIIVKTNYRLYVYDGDALDPFNTNFYKNFSWGDKQNIKDFNGDGRQDLCIQDGSNYYFYYFTSSDVLQFYSGTVTGLAMVFGDFNGDGKTDFLAGKNFLGAYTNVKINIANGNGFIETDLDPTITFNTISDSIVAYDDGCDGKDELFVIRDGLPLDPGLYPCNKYQFNDQNFESIGNGFTDLNNKNVDFNGDGIWDLTYTASDDTIQMVYNKRGNTKHRLHTIADGLNNKVIIDYESIADTSVHKMYSTYSPYPFVNFNGPLYVVSKVKQNNGLGGFFENSYKYAGAKSFKSTEMFLGFSEMEVTSSETQFTTKSIQDFHPTYPYTSESINTVIDNNGENVSQTRSAYMISHIANQRVKSYPQYTSSWDFINEVNDSSIYTFDSYGNLTHKKIYVGTSGITDSYYENYTTIAGSPVPNAPQTVRTVSQTGAKASFEKKVTINYNTTNGFVNYKIIDPDESKPLRIEYDPVSNGLGLVMKERIKGSDITDRETEYQWDSNGRYVEDIFSPEDQLTENSYDPLTGNLLTTVLPTGFTDENTYDGFGRLTYNKASGQSTSLHWYSAGQRAGCLYYAHVTGDAAPEQFVYYDTLGRDLSAEVQAYESNKTIVTNKSYNTKGQLAWVSAPFFDDETEYKTIYTYDDFGRVTEENYANNTKKINYTYSKKQLTVTNTTASQSVTKKFNEYGNVISIIDEDNNEIKYSYNSTGNVDTVYTLDGEVTTLYDEYGRPSQVKDPDLGIISYTYYVTGELKTQIKNGNTTTYSYNNNGQVDTVIVPEGTTSYAYNSNTGLLSTIDGINNNDVSFTYDNIGRITGKTETIDGQNYTFGYTYGDDHTNRLATKTYPGNFTLSYDYTGGYLDEIRNNSNNALIWQLQETSPMGQIEKYTNGNNLVSTRTYSYKTGHVDSITTGSIQEMLYTFDDATGNLLVRKDNKHNLTETFGYDDLNRLTSIYFNGQTINIDIDDNGNINSKDDLGIYEYNATQPHAVSKLMPSVTYEPEAQIATYTSFDKIDTLIQGSKNLAITYGYDFNRRKTVFTEGSTTKTKIFVPGGYEKINNGVTNEEYCYISTPAGITAVYDKTNGEMFYVHPDHLGSIHFITDENGSVEQELSFDAWGRQRNAANWGYSSLPSPKFERGYTFHEHLSEFDLINMNGRVYDPVIARFLSPDPYTQSPGNLQNYNRYSYVLNNPLKYTDPSGFKHKEWEEPWINPDAISFLRHVGNSGRTMSLYDRLTGERGISYNWNSGEYIDKYGKTYSQEEAIAGSYKQYGGFLSTINSGTVEATSFFNDVIYGIASGGATLDGALKAYNFNSSSATIIAYDYVYTFPTDPVKDAANSGDNNPYIKSITVDETTQTLSMTWDMQQKGVADVTQGGYTVSTGKRNNTPNGTYTVTWKKPHLSPPHECCRFAVNITGAFFLHTYECSNPIWTRPASAGCVRIMDPAIAEMIYNNVKIGVTQVTITGEWPGFN